MSCYNTEARVNLEGLLLKEACKQKSSFTKTKTFRRKSAMMHGDDWDLLSSVLEAMKVYTNEKGN